MKSIFRLSNLRIFSTILAVALAIPVSWKGLTGFYAWFSPFIMLNSVFVLKSFVWLDGIAFIVLIIVFFRKRWFCRHLCPVGWSIDVVFGLNNRKRFNPKRLPDISRWLALISLASAIAGIPLFIIMDPMAIFNGFFTVFSKELTTVEIISLCGFPLLLMISFIFPGLWCSKLCPLGGLQLLTDDLKNLLRRILRKNPPENYAIDPARRYFIMSGAGLLAGLAIPRFLKQPESDTIRPPAAIEPAVFNSLCIRCGSCKKACPTGIIKPQNDFNNITDWMTPKISFKSGYCLETCSLCGQVCPSGAIGRFKVEEKGKLFIGMAEVHLENCLLVNNSECVKCRESCKFNALELITEGNTLNMIPVVHTEICVGCGACEVICPTGCIKILPIKFRNTSNVSE